MNNKFLRIFLAFTLACVMLLTFVACKNGENDEETENVNTSDSIEETTAEEPTETTEALADKVDNKGANTDDVWGETTPV